MDKDTPGQPAGCGSTGWTTRARARLAGLLLRLARLLAALGLA